jgi:hypothetical protein
MAISTTALSAILGSLGGAGGLAAGVASGNPVNMGLGTLGGAGLGYVAGQVLGDEPEGETGGIRRWAAQHALRSGAAFGASPENSAAAGIPRQIAAHLPYGGIATYGAAPLLAQNEDRVNHVLDRGEGTAVAEQFPSILAGSALSGLVGGALAHSRGKSVGTGAAVGAGIGLGVGAVGSWLSQRIVSGASDRTKAHAKKVITESPYSSGYIPFGDMVHASSEKTASSASENSFYAFLNRRLYGKQASPAARLAAAARSALRARNPAFNLQLAADRSLRKGPLKLNIPTRFNDHGVPHDGTWAAPTEFARTSRHSEIALPKGYKSKLTPRGEPVPGKPAEPVPDDPNYFKYNLRALLGPYLPAIGKGVGLTVASPFVLAAGANGLVGKGVRAALGGKIRPVFSGSSQMWGLGTLAATGLGDQLVTGGRIRNGILDGAASVLPDSWSGRTKVERYEPKYIPRYVS